MPSVVLCDRGAPPAARARAHRQAAASSIRAPICPRRRSLARCSRWQRGLRRPSPPGAQRPDQSSAPLRPPGSGSTGAGLTGRASSMSHWPRGMGAGRVPDGQQRGDAAPRAAHHGATFPVLSSPRAAAALLRPPASHTTRPHWLPHGAQHAHHPPAEQARRESYAEALALDGQTWDAWERSKAGAHSRIDGRDGSLEAKLDVLTVAVQQLLDGERQPLPKRQVGGAPAPARCCRARACVMTILAPRPHLRARLCVGRAGRFPWRPLCPSPTRSPPRPTCAASRRPPSRLYGGCAQRLRAASPTRFRTRPAC
eukprot:7312342-Prymnesium_polylepis.1